MKLPTMLVTAAMLVAAALLTALLPAQNKACGFTRIDPSCGPVLKGSDQILATTGAIYHSFRFDLAGAPASAPGILAFSMKQAKIPFPGTNCFLLIDPSAMLILPFNANANGAATIRFTVKGSLRGTVFSQAAHDKGGAPVLSNGQRVTC